MLKRKRSDSRPPRKSSNGHNHNGPAKPPPTVAPQPEKAVGAFEASHADVLRALKKARGFERQRLAKRTTEEKKQSKAGKKAKGKKAKKQNEADTSDQASGDSADRLQRLEREVEVLKTLDYEVAARVHLANAMLRTRGVAEAPGPLAAHLQLASEVLSQRTKAYRTDDVHNVTSALYNRPFVRDAVAKAVRGMCQLLGLPPPDKNAPRVRKRGKEEEGDDKREEGVNDETRRNTQANTPKGKTIARTSEEDDEDEEEEGGDDDAEKDNIEYNEADDEAIERELAKYDSMLGSDSGDEDDDLEGSSDGDSDDDSDEGLDDDAVVAKLRAKYAAAVAKGLWKDDARDDFSGEDSDGGDLDEEEDEFGGFSSASNSGESDEKDEEGEEEEDDDEEDDSDSESDEDLRPRKRNATASTSVGGTSHFLPSLMGGYISDGGDSDGERGSVADDEEAAARMLSGPRKNRRGQRARQAIWEKKYKQLAKHVLEEEKQDKDGGGNGKDSKGSKENKASSKNGKQKDGGWDAKRGAVDANDKPRWLRRKMGLLGRVGPVGGGGSGAAGSKPSGSDKKDNPNANAQVSGTLHPSWEAARKAKEKAQTAAFEGKKIVFD